MPVSSWRPSKWGSEISLEYGKALRDYSIAGGSFRVFGTNGPIGWTDEPLTTGPGVILGRKGAYRGTHYSPDPFFVIDTAYYVVPKTDLDIRWLYYAMLYHQLGKIDDGSPIPSTTRSAVYARDLEVPSPDEQRRIAGVLGALDDKIEENRRTAHALERLARAIFRAWFVDFEPVKAKASGATPFPSIPQSVFDALPDALVDSKMGATPAGWEINTLTDLCFVNPSRSLKLGQPAPYLDMKNMPTNGHAPEIPIFRPFSSGAKFTNGDTLVARITPCLENGKTAFVDFLSGAEVGWGSTEYIVLRPRAPLPPIFAYLLARTAEFRNFAIQAMTGTSGRQRVPFNAFEHFYIARPPAYLTDAFRDIVEPLILRSSAATRESRKLAEIRDDLLPRLLSGRLRIERGETG